MPAHRFFPLHVETCVAAFILANAVFLANLLPTWDQRHGWPFVYMVRESRVSVEFSWYYGPWPFDNPPLVLFDPFDLTLNVAIGLVLLTASTLATEHWARTCGRRLRFGLRSSFAIVAAACILLACFRGNALSFALFIVPKYLVYFAICYTIFSVSHWVNRRGFGL